MVVKTRSYKDRLWISVVTLISLFVLGVFFIFYFFHNLSSLLWQGTQQAARLSRLPTATIDFSDKADKQDEVKEWRVYTDWITHFSMRIPSDWYLEDNADFQQSGVNPDVLQVKLMVGSFPPL